ncbi:MAG: InlB B-repeat-containing protein, partial [Eubacteriales bacterium]|nr:InlB B-repeat-containing protein [Eubacteriales bacterium]
MYKRTHKNLLAILLSLFFMFSMVPGSILHATDDDQIANPENQQAEAEAAGADNDPIAPEAEEEVGTESTGEVKSDYENKFIFRFDGREIDSQMAKDGQVLSRPQTEEYEKQGYFVEGWYLADEAGNYLASFDFEQTLNTQTSGQTYYIDLDYLIFNVYYIFLVETEDTELDNLEAFYSEAFTNKDGLSYLEKPNLFALNQEGMSVETWLVQNDAGEWVEFDFNNPIKVSEADKEFVIKGVISKIPDSSTRNIINPKPYHEYTFMLDGEVYDDGNEYNNPQIIKDGESLVEPRVPEKEDKVFLGWYKDLNDESTRIDFSQTITVQDTQEIKLHAKFGDAIKVYFKSEGAVIASKDVAPRETVDDSNVPLVILAEGKVFSHWSLEENGEEYDFNTPVEKTITLYAVLVDGHKVSFRAHGGSAHNMIMVKHNETLEGKVTNPTRPGYAFEHWSLEENGTEYDLTSPITKDIVLHAVWTAAGNTNYTVVHWQEKANSDDYEYVEQEVLTGVTGQTAGFSPKTYSGFKYNEAKSDSEKIIDGYGSTVVNVYYDRDRYTLEFWSLKQPIILYKPDKRLFTFPDIKWGADTSEWWDQAVAKYPTYSWGEKSNGEGPWYSLPPEMPQKDLTVYGRAKGSTLHANIYIEKASGKEIREAYEFYQGSIFSTQEDYVDIEGFTCIHPKEYGETWTWNSITKRYELKFYYSRNEYKITFHNDKDGANQIFSNIAFEADISGKAPADHVFGETIREADGYVFAGWFDNEGLAGEPFDFNGKTMPANNLAFYAKWAPPVHEVRAHKGIAMDEFPLQFIVDHDGKLTGDQKADMDNLKDNNVPSGQTLDDFAGWFYYLGDKFTRFDFDTPIISDLDLHAVWARDLVTITYPISAEGTETESYVKGTAAKMPKGFSCGDGKVFLGWQIKDANGQVAEKVYQPGETIVVNENIELVRVCGDPDTAITLTYNGNGGAMEGGATTHSVNLANNALVKLTNPGFTRPGYKFTGWNTEEDGTGMEFTAEMTVMVDRLNEETANILYAQWKEITIKLTVQKVWEGGTKPATTLNLKRKVGEEVDEDFVQSFTTMEGADYSNELEVTKNNASGESYTYYLEEPTVPENYIATFSEDGLTV